MSTSVMNFNPDAPVFSGPKKKSNNNSRASQQGRRAQNNRKEGKGKMGVAPPNLPFVVSPSIIDVGYQGVKTMEAPRPTLRPFSMEQSFANLAKETDVKRTLRHSWTLYLTACKAVEEKSSVCDYMAELAEADSFKSIPDFCEAWNRMYLEGPKPFSKIVVFKRGIKPVWEDPDNRKGGRFVIRGWNMEETLQMFLVIVARLMTGRLQADYNDLCGAVLQAKGNDQLWIQVWNKDASDTDQVNRVKTFLNRLTTRTVAYQVHDQSLKMQRNRQNKNKDVPAAAAPAPEPAPGKASQEQVEDFVKNFLEAGL